MSYDVCSIATCTLSKPICDYSELFALSITLKSTYVIIELDVIKATTFSTSYATIDQHGDNEINWFHHLLLRAGHSELYSTYFCILSYLLIVLKNYYIDLAI